MKGFLRLLLFALTFSLAAVASAQAPDDDWAPPAGATSAPRSAAPASAPSAPPLVSPMVTAPAPPPIVEDPNLVSAYGAQALGQWNRAETVHLGFPLLGLRFQLGVTPRLDLGVGFDSMYGVMNEPRLLARYMLAHSEHWALAASIEAGAAFFTVRAQQEQNGARWLTGRRNFNLAPGLVASYQGSHPRATRLNLEVRYALALDTEPFSLSPLDGVPPGVIAGHNLWFHFGAEMPLSSKTAFLFGLGLEAHFRSVDAPVMPVVSVGLVTSL